MQLSFATVIAALATVHTASAWKITAYTMSDCQNNNVFFLSNSREITGSQPTPCYTFGQPMPGTSCTQRRGDGVTGGCVDGGFAPKSIKAEGNCVFFAEPNCGESATGQLDITSGGSPVCVQSSIMDQKVMSYTCY